MDSEVLHVSQLYESVAAFGVLVILIAEIIICQKELWGHSFSVRFKQHVQQSLWYRQQNVEENEAERPDLEKSAIQSLRREMTEYENKNSEKKQGATGQEKEKEVKQQKTYNLESLKQLQASEKSMLLFYIEYNNFVSEHFSIIFSLLVIGMLTFSTRIYSLASFFCYLFGSLLFDFLHLQERLKAQYKRGTTLKRIVKILTSLFILGLFISYWALREYSGL